MLGEDVETRLREEYERDGYLRPDYGGYCFGSVPDTVRSLLDAGGDRPLPEEVFAGVDTDVERVVLVLVDGYGLDSWRRDHPDRPFLERLTDRGTVTPLTSVYPSETAAAITTLETGQLPCEHGRIGWNVYDPGTDRSFLALDGTVKAGDRADSGEPAPEATEGVEWLYPELAGAGVDCQRLQPFGAGGPGLNHHVYDDLPTFGERLRAVVESTGTPGYVYAYLPHIDHVSHAEGTDSAAFRETLAGVCEQLSGFVDGLDPAVARETLLLVTADHGHVNTVPEENVDLSTVDGVTATLRRYADGEPVKLAGSPRNVHLHLREVDSAREALAGLDARVIDRERALESALFGDREPSAAFRRRCGDLVLTHRDRGVWFGDVEPDELDLVGMHGGMHPSEMLVPFAAVRADRL